ncbi:flavodoxin [Anaerosporomusa subterranea]|uniref:Flavodoxin n=1 Tax=Anaerosporomusa subterranea TaxID=1794912 RepID=A0A154BMD9_ANASB|nr:flavodoxin [Anaerosporomusa subterranea]KYZ75147.1 flavodoxin [Anaerosporomusa subterranea]
MKKTLTLVLAVIIMLAGLAGCGSSKNQSNNSSPQPKPSNSEQGKTTVPPSGASAANKDGKKTLVVYFSMPETTNPNNMNQEEANSTVVINGEVLGNTQYVANLIQKNTGADIFRIEPKTPYPTNHRALVDLAKTEQNNKARPELAKKVENLGQYDVVFLGYPNWWGDMPMILYSFLESHDLSGKTIVPFNTHGGSGFSNTVSTIAALQPNANVIKNGFTVSRDTVQNCADDVAAWLKTLGY